MRVLTDAVAAEERLQQARNTLSFLASSLEAVRSDAQEYQNTLETHNSEVNLSVAAIEVLRRISQEVSRDYLGTLKGLMVDALNQVFYDQNYDIEIEVDEKRGNSQIIFYLVQEDDGEVIRSRVRDEVGDGIRCVVGLIFQVYYLNVTKGRRILIVDEAFSELADKYIEPFFDLLAQLRDRFGFRFFMISHDSRFEPYADHQYVVQRGTVKLVGGEV